MTAPRRVVRIACLLASTVGALLTGAEARAYQVTRDIPFDSPGSWPAGYTQLDIYTPNGGAAAGAVTILDLHPGGYTAGDKRDDTTVCGMLADRGFNVVSINYSLAQSGRPSYPQAIRDTKAAIRWIRTDGAARGLSPTIVVFGMSAGSTVGMAAAFSDGEPSFEALSPPPGGYRVQGAIGISGRYDLVWDATTFGTPGPMYWYLGGPYTNPAYTATFPGASAVTYVRRCSPPTKLMHGDNDLSVPYGHAVRLSQAMDAAGAFNILQIIPGAGHLTNELGSATYVVNAIVAAIPTLLAANDPQCDSNTTAPVPDNDLCINASMVTRGTSTPGTTRGSLGLRTTSCGAGTDLRDVWYRFVPPLTRRYTLRTTPTAENFDSTLAVYSGCDESAPPVLCDRGSESALTSRITMNMHAGQSYMLRVGGANGSTGEFTLSVDMGMADGISPPNDGCENATPVTLGTFTATTLNATGEVPGPCGAGDEDDVWFAFTSPNEATFRFDTEGSNLLPDTTLAVFSACGDQVPLACNDDAGPGLPFASVDVPLSYGQLALVRVAGAGGTTGTFRLNIVQVPRADQGACCTMQGCDIRNAEDCAAGSWHQYLTCTVAPCAAQPQPGACCQGSHCTVTMGAAACAGGFQGDGSACGPFGNPTTCCRANFNRTNGVTVQDIFDFLAAYFAGAPAADLNGSGGVTVQDIFDFLGFYFAGCS